MTLRTWRNGPALMLDRDGGFVRLWRGGPGLKLTKRVLYSERANPPPWCLRIGEWHLRSLTSARSPDRPAPPETRSS